jgi:hypothetical protein
MRKGVQSTTFIGEETKDEIASDITPHAKLFGAQLISLHHVEQYNAKKDHVFRKTQCANTAS